MTKKSEQNIKEAFASWLEINFLEWQTKIKRRASLQDFADHIGYSRPLISMWLSAQRLPSEEGIERLSELFGPEIYDILGLPRPDPDLQRLNKIWNNIPEKVRQSLLEQGERYATEDGDEKKRPVKNNA